MRILHNYIFRALFSTFITALLVLSFVLMVGLLFKATSFIANGATVDTVLKFLGLGFPGMLSLAIPIAALIATLLVFNRLSADSETSAMRACGVSMHRIMLTPFLLGIALSILSIYITGFVSPQSSYERRIVRNIVKTSDVLAVLQPGKSIAGVPGMPPNASVFIRERSDDILLDVRIQEPLPHGGLRDIKAREARIFQNTNGTVRLELKDVVFSPLQENRPGTGQAEYFTYVIGDELAGNNALPPRRIKDLLSPDLQIAIQTNDLGVLETEQKIADNTALLLEVEQALALARQELALSNATVLATNATASVTNLFPELEYNVERLRSSLEHRDLMDNTLHTTLSTQRKLASVMRTEATNRIVLALASLCFIAVAVPLGVKSSRRDSSLGNGICVAYGFFYYVILITADSLGKHPGYHANLLVWIPVLVGFILFIRGICKNT